MIAFIEPTSYRNCLAALQQFPRGVRNKHVRIALNAGAGVYKRLVQSMATRETGALQKSMIVKVTVPDASRNAAHHGKPAYAVIGPSRRAVRWVRSVAGRLRTVGAKTARKFGLRSIRNPARYAHLAGPGRKSTFMQRAATIGRSQATNRALWKLQAGIREEQQKLAAKNGVT